MNLKVIDVESSVCKVEDYSQVEFDITNHCCPLKIAKRSLK